ncbi:tripartite tricarboxylate transporter substrate-binding protein [Vibrio gangliei]|uniref:tripartite tricarboxylate transporter substrate-binding protein n=1 Tax=Vibrio gangliei TaxID=2077090 RepID=UPI000D01BA41|nr:tripartite tricarboxylate transporter substrate-binding protein [Vibrio gangliei]
MKNKAILGAALLLTLFSTTGCFDNKSETQVETSKNTPQVQQDTSLAWTDNTVTLYIPGKPGGGSDLTTRFLSNGWSDKTGMNFAAKNFNSTVASFTQLANKKPNGLTLSETHSALFTQYVTGSSDVDPLKDITLIAHMGNNGLRAIAVRTDAPYNTFAELVEYMKANPNTVKAGISPNGTTQFLLGTLEHNLGIKFKYVEASQETDRLTSLAGGFIDLGTVSLANGEEYEQAGKLKILGTVGANGAVIDDFMPTAPENYKTLQEMGYEKSYAVTNYYVIGPKGMDSALVEKINMSLKDLANKDNPYYIGMKGMGQMAQWHSVEESMANFKDEYESKAAVAKSLGIYREE